MQNLREIVKLFDKEEDPKRMVYRIIRSFGPIDIDSICYFCVSVFFCSGKFPIGCSLSYDKVFMFFSLQYGFNLDEIVKNLVVEEYVMERQYVEIMYEVRDRG